MRQLLYPDRVGALVGALVDGVEDAAVLNPIPKSEMPEGN